MKLLHAELIAEAADQLGLEVKVYADYSGRGMYGKTTAGLVGSLSDIVQAIACAAVALGENVNDADYDTDDFVDDLRLSMDCMGRSDIILY